ncbi:hypothetical protein [Xanthomonas campestris]|uniref:hypothetical protein n=1 Tax=Xanthomonas campestris TaxID=339 RepID=UPI0023E98098|nr:hypothetical protein [Xanthomonas campestris]
MERIIAVPRLCAVCRVAVSAYVDGRVASGGSVTRIDRWQHPRPAHLRLAACIGSNAEAKAVMQRFERLLCLQALAPSSYPETR